MCVRVKRRNSTGEIDVIYEMRIKPKEIQDIGVPEKILDSGSRTDRQCKFYSCNIIIICLPANKFYVATKFF